MVADLLVNASTLSLRLRPPSSAYCRLISLSYTLTTTNSQYSASIRPSDQSLVVPSCRSSEMLTRVELPSMTSNSSAASAVSLYARNYSPALADAYKLRELFDRSPSSSRSGTPRPRFNHMSGPQTSLKGDTNRHSVRFVFPLPIVQFLLIRL